MMRLDAKVKAVYLYPNPVDSVNPLMAWRLWWSWISRWPCSIRVVRLPQ